MQKQILTYELEAPEFDVYTTRLGKEEHCFASFERAYLWGLWQISLKKKEDYFSIIGEKFKRSKYTRKKFENAFKNWINKPFNRLDCEEVHWGFDKSGELIERDYYYFAGFEYMPSDTKADAGTHFKKGDFVKANMKFVHESLKDTVFVISYAPGKKKQNRWENYYTVVEIIKKADGRIYTNHTHFHESYLVKYTKPIDKSGPLWFLHQVFAGKIKLTKEQGNVVDTEFKI